MEFLPPELAEQMPDSDLDTMLKIFCQEVTDQDVENMKSLRNVIEEVRKRWNAQRQLRQAVVDGLDRCIESLSKGKP